MIPNKKNVWPVLAAALNVLIATLAKDVHLILCMIQPASSAHKNVAMPKDTFASAMMATLFPGMVVQLPVQLKLATLAEAVHLPPQTTA